MRMEILRDRRALLLIPLAAIAMLLACTAGEVPAGPSLLVGRAHVVVRRTADGERVLFRLPDGAAVLAMEPSPDGRLLAFAVQAPPGRSASGEVDFGADLYVAESTGKGLRRVLVHQRGEFLDTPGWLPDGRLAFVARGARDGRPHHRLEAIDLTTGERRLLAPNASAAALTPDGTRAAVLRLDREAATEAIVLVDLSSGSETVLVAPSAGFVLVTSLQVSPDGQWLAFAAAGGAESAARRTHLIGLGARFHPTLHDIWVVRLSGSGLVRVADLAELRPSLTWVEDSSAVLTLGPDAERRIRLDPRQIEVLGPGIPGGVILTSAAPH